MLRQLNLLGPVRVHWIAEESLPELRNGRIPKPPRFRSRRTVALLAYLAAERRPIARSHLAAFFWPDEPDANGRTNLRRELHNLSQVLPDCWDLTRQAASFTPSRDLSVDIYSLLELEKEKRWTEAADLLTGEFLEGHYLEENPEFETWLLAERERWYKHAVILNLPWLLPAIYPTRPCVPAVSIGLATGMLTPKILRQLLPGIRKHWP